MCCKWIFANFHSYSIVMFVTQDWVEICLTYSGPVFKNNKRFHWYEQTCGMTSDISIMWKIPWNSVRACVFSAVPCVFSCVAYKSIVRKAAFSRGLLYPGTFHDCVNYFHNFSGHPTRSYYIFTIMGSHYSLSVHRHAPACIITTISTHPASSLCDQCKYLGASAIWLTLYVVFMALFMLQLKSCLSPSHVRTYLGMHTWTCFPLLRRRRVSFPMQISFKQ